MKTLRRFSRSRFFSHARITAAVILMSAAAAMPFLADRRRLLPNRMPARTL